MYFPICSLKFVCVKCFPYLKCQGLSGSLEDIVDNKGADDL